MLETVLELLSAIPDLDIRKNEPMSAHTSFRIGGPAKFFLEAKSQDSVIRALDLLGAFHIRPFVFGSGTNLLVSDSGIDGFVLKISCSKIITVGTDIYAEAGASLAAVSHIAFKNSLTGFEFAHGIPGSVGGAVFMNAGAYGGEMCDVVTKSVYVGGNDVSEIIGDAHKFGYRTSVYRESPSHTILLAVISLSHGNAQEISEKISELAAKRRLKQPLDLPSAGSVFKRPAGNYAGALIENCGLKGYSIGGAAVSDKHAGFIVNLGGATCEDVKRLIEHIKNEVFKSSGIELECEICMV